MLGFVLLSFAPELSAQEPKFVDFEDMPASAFVPLPDNAREAFNAGTRKLEEGKLREAETLLSGALAKQDAATQPPALYNLGHVRFGLGVEELKKSADARTAAAAGRAAAQQAGNAAAFADQALASEEMQQMLSAYVRGRGARRDLNTTLKAVRKALELHGAALRRWQRSLGDFKSAAELNPSDTNAVRNAEIVDQAIAKLVDSIREMQQAAAAMAAGKQELNQKLNQLKGKIPEPLMPPDAGGGEEDEDQEGPGDRFPDLPPGQKEGPVKEGSEVRLSPEEAGRLLEGFSLDANRRLPMGQDGQAKPKDQNGRNW